MNRQKSTNLTPQQERFINFVASGQLNLELKKQTYEEFANSLGVDRSTLYSWRKSIPNFWEQVADRSNQIVEKRMPRILNAVYLKALKGDISAAKLLLNQAGRLKGAPLPQSEYDDNNDLELNELNDQTTVRPILFKDEY